MFHRKIKVGCYVVAGINAFATGYYFNYLFFYTRAGLGFGNLENLLLAALNGFIYIFGALYGGRYAQTRGYFPALRLGVSGMTAALLLGLFLENSLGQVLVLTAWTLSVCFTWPTLEAMVSEGESPATLPQMVGLYNVVWASGAALAFFAGGALVETLGWKSLFWLPAGLHVGQLGLLAWLERESGRLARAGGFPGGSIPAVSAAVTPEGSREQNQAFLRLAWVANPFAYIAMNTVLPLIPYLAKRLELSTMWAGFFCSIWLFARLGTFAMLWRWRRWHYRFDWLAGSYLLLIVSFAVLLLVPNLWAVMVAQVAFGWSAGLIYYSSLFYSMDTSTKGVHGGVHEAAIGLGIFAGPAIGAAALLVVPKSVNVSTWAVSAVLLAGFGLLNWLKPGQSRKTAATPVLQEIPLQKPEQ